MPNFTKNDINESAEKSLLHVTKTLNDHPLSNAQKTKILKEYTANKFPSPVGFRKGVRAFFSPFSEVKALRGVDSLIAFAMSDPARGGGSPFILATAINVAASVLTFPAGIYRIYKAARFGADYHPMSEDGTRTPENRALSDALQKGETAEGAKGIQDLMGDNNRVIINAILNRPENRIKTQVINPSTVPVPPVQLKKTPTNQASTITTTPSLSSNTTNADTANAKHNNQLKN